MDEDDLHAMFQLIQRFDRSVSSKWDTTVPIYVEPELKSELETRYRELVYQRLQSDESIPLRNLDFYPAVIRAALNETSIEEELRIEERSSMED